MANKKLLERIRRLLAMADDASSPNEAAIAARRVRKLMDEHQVTKEDAEGVIDEFDIVSSSEKYVTWPRWLQGVAVLVAKENDCIARFYFVGHTDTGSWQGVQNPQGNSIRWLSQLFAGISPQG